MQYTINKFKIDSVLFDNELKRHKNKLDTIYVNMYNWFKNKAK